MPTALITGCSSGIGRAAALLFARSGFHVFATVRAAADATALATSVGPGHGLQPLLVDVRRETDVRRCIGEMLAAAGRVDVLINNAGIGTPGAFEDSDLGDWDNVFQVNFWGAVRVTRAVLPQMRRQRSGRILMVSSLSARVGLPCMGAYSASKAALELASESLRLEVDRFGISVSVIEPGAIRTEMPGKIQAGFAEAPDSPYAPLLAHLAASAAAGTAHGDMPERVAELLLEIATAPRPAFRYPAGAQAHAVVSTVAGLDAAGRDAFIRSVDGTEWWSEGKADSGR